MRNLEEVYKRGPLTAEEVGKEEYYSGGVGWGRGK